MLICHLYTWVNFTVNDSRHFAYDVYLCANTYIFVLLSCWAFNFRSTFWEELFLSIWSFNNRFRRTKQIKKNCISRQLTLDYSRSSIPILFRLRQIFSFRFSIYVKRYYPCSTSDIFYVINRWKPFADLSQTAKEILGTETTVVVNLFKTSLAQYHTRRLRMWCNL